MPREPSDSIRYSEKADLGGTFVLAPGLSQRKQQLRQPLQLAQTQNSRRVQKPVVPSDFHSCGPQRLHSHRVTAAVHLPGGAFSFSISLILWRCDRELQRQITSRKV